MELQFKLTLCDGDVSSLREATKRELARLRQSLGEDIYDNASPLSHIGRLKTLHQIFHDMLEGVPNHRVEELT